MVMPWNWMNLEYSPDDCGIRPSIGDGGMTRDEAHAAVLDLVEGCADAALSGGSDFWHGEFTEAARIWCDGAKDDTVFSGPFIWCIYKYPAGEDPRLGAIRWNQDAAERMMRAVPGLRVDVHRLPE